MNGVEILSSTIIYNTILPEYFLGIGLVSSVMLVIAMAACFANDRIISGLICIVLAFGSGIIGGLGGTYSKTNINHIEYKVTIDDSVSMNEFLDKYEILGQEGKIYTVKEKNK